MTTIRHRLKRLQTTALRGAWATGLMDMNQADRDAGNTIILDVLLPRRPIARERRPFVVADHFRTATQL